jgi:hypothetical protein
MGPLIYMHMHICMYLRLFLYLERQIWTSRFFPKRLALLHFFTVQTDKFKEALNGALRNETVISSAGLKRHITQTKPSFFGAVIKHYIIKCLFCTNRCKNME